MDSRYAEKRAEIEAYFSPEREIGKSGSTHFSPYGRHHLHIKSYKAKDGAWEFTRGLAHGPDSELIADIKRNYSSFWFSWVNHVNGRYLLCGEDYQGYSILNLDSGEYRCFFPEAGHEGGGFCWVETFPSLDSKFLIVQGCYWGAPYQTVLYDFQEPEQLPYKELVWLEGAGSVEWRGADSFAMLNEVEIRLSDGKEYDDLSEAEQDELDDNPALSTYEWREKVHKVSDLLAMEGRRV